MPRFTRLEALTTILAEGVVPLFNHPDPAVAVHAARAVMDGGGRVVEFTSRRDGARDVFRVIADDLRCHEAPVVLGAGSVPDASAASAFLDLGADFIVSHRLDPEIARVCNRAKAPYLPGCVTPTEIVQAEELGCEIVKIFPARAAGGPELIRDILGPAPRSRLMPTGGVDTDPEALAAWFAAGAACVGIGSKLISADDLAAGNWEEIAGRIARVRKVIESHRPPIRETWA